MFNRSIVFQMLTSVTQELTTVLLMTSAVIPRDRIAVQVNPDSFSEMDKTVRIRFLKLTNAC